MGKKKDILHQYKNLNQYFSWTQKTKKLLPEPSPWVYRDKKNHVDTKNIPIAQIIEKMCERKAKSIKKNPSDEKMDNSQDGSNTFMKNLVSGGNISYSRPKTQRLNLSSLRRKQDALDFRDFFLHSTSIEQPESTASKIAASRRMAFPPESTNTCDSTTDDENYSNSCPLINTNSTDEENYSNSCPLININSTDEENYSNSCPLINTNSTDEENYSNSCPLINTNSTDDGDPLILKTPLSQLKTVGSSSNSGESYFSPRTFVQHALINPFDDAVEVFYRRRKEDAVKLDEEDVLLSPTLFKTFRTEDTTLCEESSYFNSHDMQIHSDGFELLKSSYTFSQGSNDSCNGNQCQSRWDKYLEEM